MMVEPRLNAKAAHQATLQYACTVLKTEGKEGFFVILMAKAVHLAWLYALAINVLRCFTRINHAHMRKN
jgi:hypothetical protein